MPSKTDAELVRLAAEKVMRWRVERRSGSRDMLQFESEGGTYLFWPTCQGTGIDRGWNPLTSDADSMMLLNQFSSEWFIRIECDERGWFVLLGKKRSASSHSLDPDRRRAILLACLRAVGEDV